jgi:hypothetical protein
VARGQVLLKYQPVAKVALARHGANPIFFVEPFQLEVRWQEPLIVAENKIELSMLHELRDAALPWKKFKLHLVESIRVLPAQARKHDCTNIIRT